MHEYCIIIYGASGDLAGRKLLPALYHLVAKHRIERYVIIGVAYEATTADVLMDRLKTYVQAVDQSQFDAFRKHFYYRELNFNAYADYEALKQQMDELITTYGFTHPRRLIYLAAAADFFCPITEYTARAGIAMRASADDSSWSRLIYEKPFGSNLATAQAINACIARYFDESQIYRIDHYLTKELVSNIALVRFANAVFEPLWNNRYIDNVQIILHETDTIGNRGAYYDAYGAISDVVQNHMLELLAIIGMETPEHLSGDFIRDRRAQVLEYVHVEDVFLGQYEGYQQEAHVRAHATTETFAALALRVNNPRWQGVPFYLKTGKALTRKETKIHIVFKTVTCLTQTCPVQANVLTIEISPEAGFALQLNAKRPGQRNELMPVTMEYCHSCIFGKHEAQAYETLLEGVMHGEQSVSVRFDEIEASWRVIDAIHKAEIPVYRYKKGSLGPDELADFNTKHAIRWLS
jgi:glucose-6-phosphate 1-dehydrogenase